MPYIKPISAAVQRDSVRACVALRRDKLSAISASLTCFSYDATLTRLPVLPVVFHCKTAAVQRDSMRCVVTMG